MPVCLMHMQGQPRDMQDNPTYTQVIGDVRQFLLERVAACEGAGIAREQLILDPGFGFGKLLQHNLELLQRLPEIVELGLPVLVGTSRKSMLGQVLDRSVDQRLHGGLAVTTMALERGAAIIRTHDVAATVDTVKVVAAVAKSHDY